MKNVSIGFLSCIALMLSLSTIQAQTPERNKETTRKILAAIDAGDLQKFSSYVSPSVIEHLPPPPGMPQTRNGFELAKSLIAAFHAGFPDSKTTILNMVAEGDMVMVHSIFTGTNTGAFMGMPGTNKAVRLEQVDVIRYDTAGKGVEHWAVIDQLTMLQQLGLIPMEGK